MKTRKWPEAIQVDGYFLAGNRQTSEREQNAGKQRGDYDRDCSVFSTRLCNRHCVCSNPAKHTHNANIFCPPGKPASPLPTPSGFAFGRRWCIRWTGQCGKPTLASAGLLGLPHSKGTNVSSAASPLPSPRDRRAGNLATWLPSWISSPKGAIQE